MESNMGFCVNEISLDTLQMIKVEPYQNLSEKSNVI